MSQITINTINWILRTIQIVGAIALPIIGWVGMNTLERIAQIEKSIVELRLDAARESSNQFTSVDWMKAKQILDEKDNMLDKRLTKNEETIVHMKEILVEIRDNQKEILDTVHKHILKEETNFNK